jgi:hypothetical protein
MALPVSGETIGSSAFARSAPAARVMATSVSEMSAAMSADSTSELSADAIFFSSVVLIVVPSRQIESPRHKAGGLFL